MPSGPPKRVPRLNPDFAAIAAMDPDAPVGLVEIMALLGATRSAADSWRSRKLLPAHDWPVGGRPAWRWRRIEEWARGTGRLPSITELS